MIKTIKAGMLGIGNVGTGTYRTLQMNRQHIIDVAGVDIEITKILNRRPDVDRGIEIDKSVYVQDVSQIMDDPEISIVIELIGGVEPATSYMAEALKKGKHVVTANKAALAVNGKMLQQLAQENNVMLRFEASVGGGIPILRSLTGSLMSNQVEEILGIVNGTTNYILTQMTEKGADYADVLKSAQEKGFAEADPSGDVEGHDSANKLSVLLSLVFGVHVLPSDIPTVGITSVNMDDIKYANQFGCKIKLIAAAKRIGDSVECDVQPTLIPEDHPLSSVSNEFNAIFVKGNAVDDLMYYGKGAGPLPTGSAVMGDVIEIASAVSRGTAFDEKPLLRYDSSLKCTGEGSSQYYVRMTVDDRPGMLGSISSTLGKYSIGIESMMQNTESRLPDGTVPLVFIFYEISREQLDRALAEIVDNKFAKSIDSVIKVQK